MRNKAAENSRHREPDASVIPKKISPAALDKRPLGIYLHIPFCVKKCLYCDFLSGQASDETIARYVDALCRQIEAEALDYRDYRVNTVFLGGGTPSLLSGEQLSRILQTVFSQFTMEDTAEITMESNPGTLTGTKLSAFREAGINRLSIGLQSADNAQLACLGRIHTWETFLENFQAARAAGFTNINIDLMSALPGQTFKDWMETLHKVTALQPEHISAYSLIIEEGTPFYERYEVQEGKGWAALPSEDEERQMYVQTEQFLKERGYHRYEISNYARKGRECRHNVGCWNRTEYLGFGIGAASLADNTRFRVISELDTYLQLTKGLGEDAGADDNRLFRDSAGWRQLHEPLQRLSIAEQMEEFMFLGLRLTAGISVEAFQKQFGRKLHEIYGKVLKKLEEQELVRFYEEGKMLQLTERGIDVSNYVLAQFLLEET